MGENGDAKLLELDELTKLVTMCIHPVVQHKVTQLRREETSSKHFRELLRELTMYLGYECSKDLETKNLVVKTPLANHTGKELATTVGLVPILRSGMGMLDPMLDILPHAQVYHIGMYRDKRAMLPILYYNKLPVECTVDRAIILEPVIATSITLNAVIDILEEWGAPEIHVLSILASRQGLSNLLDKHPDVKVTVAAIDNNLREGLIVPGLGDVGDRLFNSTVVELSNSKSEDEPAPKRKKR